MKIVCISDTHSSHSKLFPGGEGLPSGDILVHSGDATSIGTLSQHASFLEWIWNIENAYRAVLFVPGNHDFATQHHRAEFMHLSKKCTRLTTLINESIVIDSVKFYGTPWQPKFGQWSWGLDRYDLYYQYLEIEDDTDVLITHCPAMGILDKMQNKEHVGSAALRDAFLNIPAKPKVHIFGHIHEAYGIEEVKHGDHSIVHVNSCMLDHNYRPCERPPIVIDYDIKTKSVHTGRSGIQDQKVPEGA